MIKINKSNYEEYKQIFFIIGKIAYKQWGLDPDSDSSAFNTLRRWEKKNLALAIKGLRASLPDILTMITDFPNDTLSDIDKELNEKGFPKLKILTASIRNTPNKVISRGRIKNIEEYHIIMEILNTENQNISPDMRLSLNKILVDFESNYKN